MPQLLIVGKKQLLDAARKFLRSLPLTVQQRIRRERNKRAKLPSMSIGLAKGSSPWTLVDDTSSDNPIVTAASVTDADAAFVADPFAHLVNDQWHLFFEFMNRKTGKGEIGLSTSRDLSSWSYQGTVLSEAFHLSYPGIYHSDGSFWMVPESWESGQVRLYRAVDFPNRWVLDRVLLSNTPVTDPTIFREEDGSWSMLACDAGENHNQNLRRFIATDIRGPWREASNSPLLTARPEQARPGGPVVNFDGKRFRMGQDCSVRYGESLRSYPLQSPWDEGGQDVIAPTGRGWRSKGGHHADIHVMGVEEVIAFIDGES